MTESLYCVIQVVPDPVRDERINVGVVVVSPDSGFLEVQVRPKRQELRALAPSVDTRFLSGLADDLSARLSRGPDEARWGATTLFELHQESANTVQFTRPGVSSRPPADLLQHLLERFVERKPSPRQPRRYRDKGMLKRNITRTFKRVGLEDRIEKNFQIEAERARCVFDYGLRPNGVGVGHALQAVSLEPRDREALETSRRELHAFAFDAEQVRDQISLSLIAYLRHDGNEIEDEAQAITHDLGVALVAAEDFQDWAHQIAANDALLSAPN